MKISIKKLQKSKELLKLLKFHGWKIVAIKGSHYQLKHHEINGRVTLPHPKDLPIGTLKSVLKQAKIKIKNE
jgi:predicted RNA binding protein YcfA (HicA-like mRNA interferase family)